MRRRRKKDIKNKHNKHTRTPPERRAPEQQNRSPLVPTAKHTTFSAANTPQSMVEHMLKKWNRWSTTEKFGYTIVFLLAIGATGYTLYYSLPIMIEFFQNNATTIHTQQPHNNNPINLDTTHVKRQQSYSPQTDHQSTARLFHVQSQPALDKLIKAVPIFCPAHYLDEFTNVSPKWKTLIEQQITKIRNILSDYANNEVTQLILKDSQFSIQVVPANDPELTGNGQFVGVEGRYLPRLHKIVIVQDSDFSKQYLTQIIKKNCIMLASIKLIYYGVEVH